MRYITVLILIFSATAVFAQDTNPVGIITATQGEVTISDESGTFEAVAGTPVKLGDTIETGEESGVKILFDDDSLFSLGDNTSVVITEFIYTPQERKSISNITKGKMRAIFNVVESKDSDIEIKTPNGVAGIKGTTLYANADNETFCLRTGEIFVRGINKKKTVTLTPNECTYIIDGEPIAPEKISDEVWLKFKEETDIYEGSGSIYASSTQNYPGKGGTGAAPPLSTLINISQFPSVPPFNQSPLDNIIVPVTVNVNIN